MATLQKFKLLATQCAVARSPSRSPTASPVIHLRRRKTLRMLLSRGGKWRDHKASLADQDSPKKGKDLVVVSHKLKDLFLSSPSPEKGRVTENDGNYGGRGSPVGWRRGGGVVRQVRPLSATFRQRLLRRAWRPVLVAIPEN